MDTHKTLKPLQDLVGANSPMFGAALITDDGIEVPITVEMIEESIGRIEAAERTSTAQPIVRH